jgi:hypothetical protein
MAYHWIGRDDDHKYPSPPWPTTDTDDEDEDSKTSSSVNKQPQETPTIEFEELGEIATATPTSYYPYPTKMSLEPSDRTRGRPWTYTTPPPWATRSNDDDHDGPPRTQTQTTFSTEKTALGDSNGSQSPTSSATLTQLPTHVTSYPAPTGDGISDLQNNGADNSPNRTPIYAAAGVTPVMVIIIGFFVFCCLRKRRRQRRAAAEHGHIEEMKMQPKPVQMPYIAPITPPSPPPAVLLQYSPSTPSSSHPPTASSSQPVILGPIPSGNNGAYLTGMDTSDLVSMTSASNISRMGTVVDRDPFADGRSLEEAPPPYRPSSLPPASLASTSRNSSIRIAAPPQMTSRTQLIERSPFDDPEDNEVSELSGPTLGQSTDAMSDVSDLSYQVDPVVGRSPF